MQASVKFIAANAKIDARSSRCCLLVPDFQEGTLRCNEALALHLERGAFVRVPIVKNPMGFHRSKVPHSNFVVTATGNCVFANQLDAQNVVVVGGNCVASLISDIPNCQIAAAAASDRDTIGVVDAIYAALFITQRVGRSIRTKIPEHRVAPLNRHENIALELEVSDCRVMSLEGVDDCVAFDVPQPDDPVRAARDHSRAFTMHARHRGTVIQNAATCVRRQVPSTNGCVSTCREQLRSLDVHGCDAACVLSVRPNEALIDCVPDRYEPVAVSGEVVLAIHRYLQDV